MTHRPDDVADRRDLYSRWCALAEQRLEYLTRLFESERWRRYYSELAFLQNIREAKTAVETWRSLSAGGATASVGSEDFQMSAPPVAAEPVPETAIVDEVEQSVPDLAAIERRYPLLRNTL